MEDSQKSNTNQLILYYKNQMIETKIPENSFNLNLLNKLFSEENLSKVITSDNAFKLMKFLPKNDSNLIFSPKRLSDFLLNKVTKFNSPINDFYQKYLHNFFTFNYQNKSELFKIENISDYMDKKQNIYIQLQNILNKIQKNINNQNNFNNNINNNNINNINTINNINNINNLNINPNIIRNTHSNHNENLVTFDMHSELASSGYTSLDVDKDSKHSNSRKNSGNFNIGDKNSMNNSNLKDQQNLKYGLSINSLMNKSGQKKMISSTNNSYVEHSDENDSFIDRNILKSERFKNVKKNKIQITIKPRTKEEILNFRQQEKLRYEKPLSPWEYTLSNGNIAIVAPLFTSSKTIISKARDHELLKAERPPYITLLALVRDAAARLEDGVGTRLDICDLLKDSQYINENISDNRINNIVSGALDRLHYQKDPCVKYDSHHKLWIYLHRNRSLDYPGWKKIENNEENNTLNVDKINENPETNNNIIIEDLDDNEIENNPIHKKKGKKTNEIIEVGDDEEEQIKEVKSYGGKHIYKIKTDSDELQQNLIELNEQLYNSQHSKKSRSMNLIGKKRNKK